MLTHYHLGPYTMSCIQEFLLGDYSKAKRVLGWEPKTKFKVKFCFLYTNCKVNCLCFCLPLCLLQDLVKEMVASDVELLRKTPTA